MYFFIRYNLKNDKEIDKIIKCIEDINHKNYELKLDDISENKLSILKQEIYKTTIMLKENAENSLKDKINLKKSLQDISHQLKTPITEIHTFGCIFAIGVFVFLFVTLSLLFTKSCFYHFTFALIPFLPQMLH